MEKFFAACGLVFLLLLSGCQPATEQQSLADYSQRLDAEPGLFTLYRDNEAGKVYLQVPASDQQYLYYSSLPQGLGSNDIGLDRGQLMELGARLVSFEDAGDKMLLRQHNTQFRAESNNPLEQRSVDEAFASAIIGSFSVVARDATSVLIDATDFVVSDSHGVARILKARGQGDFTLTPSHSALYWPRTKSFERNTELEATLTFTSDNPGNFVRQVAPDPYQISVRVHHSFVALPEPGFVPRTFHPQSGFWSFDYEDYAAPIDQPITQRVIPRHRLAKKDPTAALSEAVEPIVYYLDAGTPEPIRSALLDGARWWNDAFTAAGYKDAFVVKMMPEGADAMDVRYNMIQWVHRATRGWSYGSSVIDPRTGEIIKGHVTLGSLRVRQDYLLAQGMTSPFTEPDIVASELTEMALARIRQLSAHEIGHTLGIAHNFAASNQDRASVMDYPHPKFTLTPEQSISLNDAYATGIGAWDKRVVQYGYGDFADDAARLAFIAESNNAGFVFMSDADSNGISKAHAFSSLWDGGADAVTELERILAVRQQGLANFSPATLAFERPYSDLAEILVPLYFSHRYQTEAVGKWLGGYQYSYQVKTANVAPDYQPLSGAEQQRALAALLKTLEPAQLALSAQIQALIPPKAYGYRSSRESPQGYTGLIFDPLSLAEAAANQSFAILLDEQRLARLQWQHQFDNKVPSVSAVLAATWQQIQQPVATQPLLSRRMQISYLQQLLALAKSAELAPELRAELLFHLQGLSEKFALGNDAHHLLLLKMAGQVSNAAADLNKVKTLQAPPGSPI
ncbi:MAG: zinc-dependent metalloprotease [Alishewanella sp.]|nr:zinc-dependent metalloprotease [Alishewanella sp.]